jgi:UDP-3-O-[3-hydroxymyristoyl] N-acetylglucosamine deacetylase
MELTFPGGGSVRTVEHLLAAIAGVGLDDAVIAPEGPEIPILDGSAFLFASAMIEGGVVETDIPYNPAYLSSPICVCDGPSSVCAIPSEEFRITYVIDYPGSAIGTEMKDVLVTEETFMSEIAPARTFCLESEADSLREAGLALGGSLENTLVIGAGGPLGSGYRVERECAAHKIADFMGDMACAGFTANARYICVRAGHRLHSRLMDRIAKSALNNSGR